MPKIGEIRQGGEIGYKTSSKYIWQLCPDCGKGRWVQLWNDETTHRRCRQCACRRTGLNQRGKRSRAWKGGYVKNAYGYIEVYVGLDDFFRPMSKKTGYVLEHRLVVAKALGRCLQSWEIVHHREGFAKDDNRYPETLQLVTDDRHNQITIMERRIKKLEDKVDGQQNLIKLLQWQLKERQNVPL